MQPKHNNRLERIEKQILARYALVYDAYLPTLSDAELDRLLAHRMFATGRSPVEPGPDDLMDWQTEVKICAAFQKVWGSYPKGYLEALEESERKLSFVPGPDDTVLDRVKRIADHLEAKHGETIN